MVFFPSIVISSQEGWMKIDVLNDIKKAEKEYQSMVREAQEEKRHRHSQAELEADNLVAKAKINAEEYKKLKFKEARDQAKVKQAEVLKAGNQQAAALKEKGALHLPKAVQLLLSRFKEQLHVKA
jgi:V/A-type H+-transporting ATPase subunit G/H